MQPCRRHWWSALPIESRVAFHIGESSGEDDDDPNVATGDERAPPMSVVVRAVTRHVAAWR
jgi:hypothetical protein